MAIVVSRLMRACSGIVCAVGAPVTKMRICLDTPLL